MRILTEKGNMTYTFCICQALIINRVSSRKGICHLAHCHWIVKLLKDGHWGTQRLSDLPKTTQLVSARLHSQPLFISWGKALFSCLWLSNQWLFFSFWMSNLKETKRHIPSAYIYLISFLWNLEGWSFKWTSVSLQNAEERGQKMRILCHQTQIHFSLPNCNYLYYPFISAA